MKGRLPGYHESDDPHRDLLAEVLLVAIRDARRGDPQARAWLREGAVLAFEMLDITVPSDLEVRLCPKKSCRQSKPSP